MKWTAVSRATAIVRSAASPVMNASAPSTSRLREVVRAGASHDPQAPHERRPGVEHERIPCSRLAHASPELRDRDAVTGQVRDEADRLVPMDGERLERLRSEGARQQRVVAELGVRIQREVVGGEGDVRVEEELQAALQRYVDRPRPRAPEEPVVHDQELRPGARRQLEQLGVRRDAGGQRAHLRGAWDLEPVRAIVLEPLRFQQLVDLSEDVLKRRGHRPKRIAVWNTHRRVGAWRSLVARTVRVGEVPSSNLGAPIKEPLLTRGFLRFRDRLHSGVTALSMRTKCLNLPMPASKRPSWRAFVLGTSPKTAVRSPARNTGMTKTGIA